MPKSHRYASVGDVGSEGSTAVSGVREAPSPGDPMHGSWALEQRFKALGVEDADRVLAPLRAICCVGVGQQQMPTWAPFGSCPVTALHTTGYIQVCMIHVRVKQCDAPALLLLLLLL